jgi:hypothetical protein
MLDIMRKTYWIGLFLICLVLIVILCYNFVSK